MARFIRKGPACVAPDVSAKVIATGETVEAPLTTGWAQDPDWQLEADSTPVPVTVLSNDTEP